MILSDGDLELALGRGRLVVDPMAEDAIQPASIDLRLGAEIAVAVQDADIEERFKRVTLTVDPFGDLGPSRISAWTASPRFNKLKIPEGKGAYVLSPGQFLLGCTLERVTLGDDLVARVEGRSTLGRMGLLIHATAGFVDPGFSGNLTLEIYNASRNNIALRRGMPIAQLAVEELSSAATLPYGHPSRRSKYQGQTGATAPRELNEKKA